MSDDGLNRLVTMHLEFAIFSDFHVTTNFTAKRMNSLTFIKDHSPADRMPGFVTRKQNPLLLSTNGKDFDITVKSSRVHLTISACTVHLATPWLLVLQADTSRRMSRLTLQQ